MPAGLLWLNPNGLRLLVDELVCFVTSHFANRVLKHDILLEEVVDRNFVLGVVVHRALEEEAQEVLDAITATTCGEVDQQAEVKAEGSGKD